MLSNLDFFLWILKSWYFDFVNNLSKFNFDIILKSLILSFLLILNDNSFSELKFIGLSSIKSKLKSESILIDYKSQRIKKYFSDFKNQIKFSNSHLDLDYKNKKFKFNLKSKYSIDDINENVSLNVEKKDNKYFFDLDLDLDSAEIDIEELDYQKRQI